MNTPNKLTVARMIAVPFFLATFCLPFKHSYLAALIIFCLASLTDYFDGKLARKHGLITNFGKFLDPLADKMLTTSALLGFIALGNEHVYGALWVAFITLLREFLVAGIRLSAVADGGKVVAANMWGKCKTVAQMAAIIFILFTEWLETAQLAAGHALQIMHTAGSVLLWISTLLAIISGAIYVVQNAAFISDGEK